MSFSMARFYKRERLELDCEVVTPMFLGDARQQADWRTAPFKGLIRYWWRIAQHDQKDRNSLAEAESKLFGSAGDQNEEGCGKSMVEVMIRSHSKPEERWEPIKLNGIRHPEKGTIDPLLYLAGMGLMEKGRPNIGSFLFRPGFC